MGGAPHCPRRSFLLFSLQSMFLLLCILAHGKVPSTSIWKCSLRCFGPFFVWQPFTFTKICPKDKTPQELRMLSSVNLSCQVTAQWLSWIQGLNCLDCHEMSHKFTSHAMCVPETYVFVFGLWSSYVSSSLWLDVSKVTSLSGIALWKCYLNVFVLYLSLSLCLTTNGLSFFPKTKMAQSLSRWVTRSHTELSDSRLMDNELIDILTTTIVKGYQAREDIFPNSCFKDLVKTYTIWQQRGK